MQSSQTAILNIEKVKSTPDGNKITEQKPSSPPEVSPFLSRTVAIVVVILTLFIAITATVRYAMQEQLPTEYNQVIANWQHEPILTIRPNVVGCREYLTHYSFPGTISGCSCLSSTSSDYVSQGVFAGNCDEAHLKTNCVNVKSVPAKEFTSWHAGSFDFQLCVERFTGFTYLDSDCSKTGFKKCNSALGITTNVICIPSQISCPITDIVLSVTLPDNTYTSIFDTGSAGKIYVSRTKTSSSPIAFTTISPSSKVCNYFENLHYIDDGITPYVLLANKDNTCKSEATDSRFHSVFTSTESDFLSANSYLARISALPNYPLAQSQTFMLNTREYVRWTQDGDCRTTHLGNFVKISQDQTTLHRYWTGFIVASWFVFALFGCLVSYFRLKFVWRVRDWYVLPTVLLLLLQLALMVYIFVLSLQYNNSISGIAAANCSDDRTNAVANSMNQDFYGSVFMYMIILIAAVGFLMLFTIFFCKIIFKVTCCTCCKKSNKDDDLNSNNDDKNKKNSQDDEQKNLFNAQEDIDEAAGLNKYENKSPIKQGFANTYKLDDEENSQHSDIKLNQDPNTQQKPTETGSAAAAGGGSTPLNNKNSAAAAGAKQAQGNSNQNSNRLNSQGIDQNTQKQQDSNRNNNNQGTAQPAGNQLTGENLAGVNGLAGDQSNRNAAAGSKSPIGGTKESGQKVGGTSAWNLNANPNNNRVAGEGQGNIEMQITENPGVKYDNTAAINLNRSKLPQSQQNVGSRAALIDERNLGSTLMLEDLGELRDNNEWEFDIEDYVKKHREKQLVSSRIGGGYDIGKPREKYLGHKFQASHITRNPNQNTAANHITPSNPNQEDNALLAALPRSGAASPLHQNDGTSSHNLDQQSVKSSNQAEDHKLLVEDVQSNADVTQTKK